MNRFHRIGATALLIGAAVVAHGQSRIPETRIVTASNTTANTLLVYDTSDNLIQSIATGGEGGASGNSGGIARWRNELAVINFGSKTVSIFEDSDKGFQLKQTIPTASSPLSVAFGHGHLYVLGATVVESHAISDYGVDAGIDGSAGLIKADGSAAQVGVLEHQLILTEKSNAIESVNLDGRGAIRGTASLVQNIPQNVNAPFGLVTRGDDAYVTIAHANEISLVRDDAVVTTTGSGSQSAPCWLALDGPYLFSSNSPSHSVSRYVVYGKTITQAVAVAATFSGDPTDIAYRAGVAAVVDGAGTVSHLTSFLVDGDGNLSQLAVTTINSSANGVAIVRSDD